MADKEVFPKKRVFPKKEEKDDRIVIFDGVCNLCNRAVQFIIRRDPRAGFKFAALQSDYAQVILKDREYKFEQPDFILYVRGNKIHVKSTAVLFILKDLGGIWNKFYAFMILPKFIRDYLYDKIAKNRYTLFGKKETCMIPGPDIKSRFPE